MSDKSPYIPGQWCPADPDVVPDSGHYRVLLADMKQERWLPMPPSVWRKWVAGAFSSAAIVSVCVEPPAWTPPPLPEPSLFEVNRSDGWREALDSDGVPTCGPERCGYGCHYCAGPLDAKPGTGQYECPWCIARFPFVASQECSATKDPPPLPEWSHDAGALGYLRCRDNAIQWSLTQTDWLEVTAGFMDSYLMDALDSHRDIEGVRAELAQAKSEAQKPSRWRKPDPENPPEMPCLVIYAGTYHPSAGVWVTASQWAEWCSGQGTRITGWLPMPLEAE